MATNPSRRAGSALAFNPHVAALPAYNAGMNVAVARSISGRNDIARLGSNENPYGCSPAVLQALSSAEFEPWRYADPACRDLRSAIGSKVGIAPEQIVVGNGSEELIAAISRAFLVPGGAATTVVPSFGLHEIEPLAAGASVTKVPMTADLDFDLDALERALSLAPQIFFLPSPWNPVGPALGLAALERLARATSPATLFVLDEAYREFADPSTPDGIEVLQRLGISYVVLRTFSKAYGLAGLRVGYAVCSDAEIARVIAAAKPPFNVNAAAQIAAIAALGDEAWMKDSVAQICEDRERVRKALVALGLRVAPSQTNFLFFDCGVDSTKLAADLVRDGIIVKAWRESGYEHFLRATIGRPEENDHLVRMLAKHLGR